MINKILPSSRTLFFIFFPQIFSTSADGQYTDQTPSTGWSVLVCYNGDYRTYCQHWSVISKTVGPKHSSLHKCFFFTNWEKSLTIINPHPNDTLYLNLLLYAHPKQYGCHSQQQGSNRRSVTITVDCSAVIMIRRQNKLCGATPSHFWHT